MTLDEYAREARKTARYPGAKYAAQGCPPCHLDGHAVGYAVSALAGEAGEVAQEYAKSLRDDSPDGRPSLARRERMIKEAGDVLWQLSALCDVLGVTLEEVARLNLSKLSDRAERGVLHGSGDDR